MLLALFLLVYVSFEFYIKLYFSRYPHWKVENIVCIMVLLYILIRYRMLTVSIESCVQQHVSTMIWQHFNKVHNN